MAHYIWLENLHAWGASVPFKYRPYLSGCCARSPGTVTQRAQDDPMKYYAQTRVVTSESERVSPGSACSQETQSQVKRVQLRKEIVRFQIVILRGSAVSQAGVTL